MVPKDEAYTKYKNYFKKRGWGLERGGVSAGVHLKNYRNVKAIMEMVMKTTLRFYLNLVRCSFPRKQAMLTMTFAEDCEEVN